MDELEKKIFEQYLEDTLVSYRKELPHIAKFESEFGLSNLQLVIFYGIMFDQFLVLNSSYTSARKQEDIFKSHKELISKVSETIKRVKLIAFW